MSDPIEGEVSGPLAIVPDDGKAASGSDLWGSSARPPCLLADWTTDMWPCPSRRLRCCPLAGPRPLSGESNCETCTSVALVFCARRMPELALSTRVLDGTAIDNKSFFYGHSLKTRPQTRWAAIPAMARAHRAQTVVRIRLLSAQPGRLGEIGAGLRLYLGGEGVGCSLDAICRRADQGYPYLFGFWKHGYRIDIDSDTPVRAVAANPLVVQDARKAAMTRGPIVYCAEEMDNRANLHLLHLDGSALSDDASRVKVEPFAFGVEAVRDDPRAETMSTRSVAAWSDCRYSFGGSQQTGLILFRSTVNGDLPVAGQ